MRKKLYRSVIVLIIISFLVLSQSAVLAETQQSRDVEYLKSVMEMIKEKYNGEVTDKALIEGALKGMFGTMDNYTVYFDKDQAENFLTDVGGNYQGVGVMISKLGDYIIITKIFSPSPAESAGIAPGSKIAAIDGKNVVGASLDEVAKLVRGEAGSKVKVGIIKEGEKTITNYDLVRGQIKVNPVSYEIRGDVAYVKLDVFNSNTTEYFLRALKDLDGRGIKKMILDLRDNPGGEVNEVVEVAKRLVPKGLITRLDFKSEDIQDKEYYSSLENPKYKLAVLVNGMSASASEVLAGALQDTGAGTLIGTKTFGKAKVQNLVPMLTPEAYEKYQKQLGVGVINAYDLINKYRVMPKNSEILGWSKITTGQYTTPKGRMIDMQGLTPDIVVEGSVKLGNIDVNNIQKLEKKSKFHLGDEGLDVFNAEKILKAMGYEVNTPDMNYDDKTAAAVASLQAQMGFWPDGFLDFTTQDILNNQLELLRTTYDKQYMKALEVVNSNN